MNLKKIPSTVVTGFLGSGKTTLLSNIIKQANGKRIAVIVNEFGEMDIDADLLRNCPLDCEEDTRYLSGIGQTSSDRIYELANGCICCTVEDEFLPVMEQLVKRRDYIDHILIETSGLALPKPLVQAFNWPEVKQYCTVDSVITVVDGPAVAAGRIAHNPVLVEKQRMGDSNLDHDTSLQELLEDQLTSADMVIISKSDLISADQIDLVKESMSYIVKPEVKMFVVNHGAVASELIMGLEFASEEHIDKITTHHDYHHNHDEEHHHAHDDFNSVSIRIGEVDGDKLLTLIKQLLTQQTIFRVKGFLALPGKPMRQVFHGVGKRFDQYFDRLWGAGENRCTRLVFIGKGLQVEALTKVLQQAVVMRQ